LAVVDISVVYLALPAIGKSLGAGIADQQWIVNIYALMEGGFTLASGTLGDLYGRKRVFVGGVALFVAGAVGSALAMTPTVLIVARLVQGIGGAVLLSLSLALLTGMLADPKEDDDAVRTFSMTAGLGAVAGVVLGGVLVQFLGWRSIFAMSALFGALVLPLTLRYVPETARNLAQPVDVAGQLLSVLAFVALSFALIAGNARGWTSPTILGIGLTGVVCLVAFAVVEQRSSHPMLRLEYLRNRTFVASLLGIAINNYGWYGSMLLATLFLQNVLRDPAFIAALYMMPCNIGFVLFTRYNGSVVHRLGTQGTIIVGSALEIIALLTFAVLSPLSPSVAVGAALFLCGIGCAFIYPPATALGMRSVAMADEGLASGMINLSRALGGVFAVAFLGALLSGTLASNITTALVPLNLPASVVHRVASHASRERLGAPRRAAAGSLGCGSASRRRRGLHERDARRRHRRRGVCDHAHRALCARVAQATPARGGKGYDAGVTRAWPSGMNPLRLCADIRGSETEKGFSSLRGAVGKPEDRTAFGNDACRRDVTERRCAHWLHRKLRRHGVVSRTREYRLHAA